MSARETAERNYRAVYGERPGRWHQVRIYFLMAVFWAAFAVVGVRLYFVHLDPAPELTRENAYHEGEVKLPISRGDLRDRNGIVLATDDRVPTLVADPSRVKNPERIAQILSRELGIPEEETHRNLRPTRDDGVARRFAYLARWVTHVAPEALELLVHEIDDEVNLRYEPMRYYPQQHLAAQALGFVNRVGDASEGLELKCDSWLRGVAGTRRARKDARETLLSSLTLEYQPPSGGHDVYLTIDANIQRKLENAIQARMEELNAPRGMGMLMDPKTGAILAFACLPSYDPNHYEESSKELRTPRALTHAVEPGSVFKIVTAAAVLEHGLVTPDTLIDCEGGSFNPYGHRINDVHKMGIVPFSLCFAESSNVAHIKVAALLGPERLEQWIQRFGFGQRATRELGGMESTGIFRPRNKWSRLSMGSLPMGQEISCTLPQLTRAFAVIANGGLLVEPYFVDRVIDRDGNTVHRGMPATPRRIISEKTAETMRDLCHQTVLHGTGSRASIELYRVGGKTGTAQRSPEGQRGYAARKYTSIFVGFAPVADPRIVGTIVVEEPDYGKHYGGYACGPVFKSVVGDALALMQVPEDPVVEEDGLPVNTLADADTATTPAPLEPAAADPVVLEPLDDLELIARELDGTEWVRGLPDFTGMTMRQARERLLELGIPWDPSGTGRVVQQRPEPGTPVTKVELCRLFFANSGTPVDDDTSQTL
jgi:cell division protein FtsI (penicillin-binding protein 3)